MRRYPETIRAVARAIASIVILSSLGALAGAALAEEVPLSSLDLTKMSSGWGKPVADRSIVEKPLSIGGRRFEYGVGTHAPSVLWVELDGRVERFSAFVGVDDETGGKGSVRFRIVADGKRLLDSGTLRGGDASRRVEVGLAGVRRLLLLVTEAGDGINFDHADWAEAAFTCAGARPRAVERPVVKEEREILTPPPGPAPRINGPRVYGGRPGHPFIWRIPCTGTRPIAFSAEGLPPSLRLDARRGIIRGRCPESRGTYEIVLGAENDRGRDRRRFRIVVGDQLALTPPMGWNHWYTHYQDISAEEMRRAADILISSGMADHGYEFVNIDDCWMVKEGAADPRIGGVPRDEKGAIRANRRFGDMRALTDYIHEKGLKAGLYTSPGPTTCQGFVGSWRHEEVDARKFAEWGFDFLKYDWCSYGRVAGGRDLEHLRAPYEKMGKILADLDRDIVFNLCQYGMGEVPKWAGSVGGNCWRTTGDLGLARGGLLPGFFHIGLSNARWAEHARPGQWNDPDYILIGKVGNAFRHDDPPVPTRLTPSEQYAYMSLWCLMAAPLFYSGHMASLDEFTLGILCNREVIDVDQDPLGRQARIVRHGEDDFLLAKPLEDGSLAVGLFNLGEFEREIGVRWSELELEGPRRARDLWRQKDIGTVDHRFASKVRRHGVRLVRLLATGGGDGGERAGERAGRKRS